MSTTEDRKSFIGGHVREEVHAKLAEDADEHDISRAKLLDMILAEWYGIDDIPVEYDSR